MSSLFLIISLERLQNSALLSACSTFLLEPLLHLLLIAAVTNLPISLAIKKISQRSREGLTEVLNEVRVLSQLSHPNVVRYFNTWVEDIYDSSGAFDTSTDDESSETDTSQAGPDVEFTQSQRGLDFISDPGFVIEFEDADSEAIEDDEGDDEDEDESSASNEESEDEDNAKKLELPERKNERRLSHRPFKTILYISMEYCDKQVSRSPTLLLRFIFFPRPLFPPPFPQEQDEERGIYGGMPGPSNAFFVSLTCQLYAFCELRLTIYQCLRDLIYADLYKNETEIWRRRSF